MLNFIYPKKVEKELEELKENLEYYDVLLSHERRDTLNNTIKKNILSILSCDRSNKMYYMIRNYFEELDIAVKNYLAKKKTLAQMATTQDTQILSTLSFIFQNLYLEFLIQYMSFKDKELNECYNTINTWLLLREERSNILEEAKIVMNILRLYVTYCFNDNLSHEDTMVKIGYLLQRLKISKENYDKLFSLLLNKDVFYKEFGKTLEKIFLSKLNTNHIATENGIVERMIESCKENLANNEIVFDMTYQYEYDVLYNAISSAIEACDEKISEALLHLIQSGNTYTPTHFYKTLMENPNVFQTSTYCKSITLITSEFYSGLYFINNIQKEALVETITNIANSCLDLILSIKVSRFSKELFHSLLTVALYNKSIEIKKTTESKVSKLDSFNINANGNVMFYNRCLEWYHNHKKNMMAKKNCKPSHTILMSLILVLWKKTIISLKKIIQPWKNYLH
ncbi:MAG: hypothetical protein Q4D02_01210 [Clostridia bacterium]|nr:hypothetical protein [Clostridia bacterium]